jgi:hypothetical protein
VKGILEIGNANTVSAGETGGKSPFHFGVLSLEG